MRKNLLFNNSFGFFFFVLVVFGFCNCRSNRLVGTYNADTYYFGMLHLWEDGSYKLIFPSISGTKEFVENRGTWKNGDSVLYLTSYDERKLEDYVFVVESNEDSSSEFVRFYFSVKDSLGLEQDVIPPFTISKLKLSGDDSIFGIMEINGKNIKWPKQRRKYWILEDVHGFLPPYIVHSIESSEFNVTYLGTKGVRVNKQRMETFVDEKLVVNENGDLIFRNGIVLKKQR